MIRFTKPVVPPKILRKRGQRTTEALCAAHDAGETNFEFDSSLYGAKSVKNMLKKAQFGKCCFCESKITSISYGDVEHYRPKGGYRQNKTDALTMPGYYWLAYDWGNLFFSCQLCNQRFKKNLFPLHDPGNRATNHTGGITNEEPLLVNPCADNPGECISFREEIPYGIDEKSKGSITIEVLGLDRVELNEARKNLYDKLKLIYSIAYADPPRPETEEARQHLDECTQSHSEYAAMTQTALRNRFSANY